MDIDKSHEALKRQVIATADDHKDLINGILAFSKKHMSKFHGGHGHGEGHDKDGGDHKKDHDHNKHDH